MNGQNLYGRDTMMAPMNPNEYVIPAPVVQHKGIEFFDNLIRKTLSQIGASQQQVSQGGRGSPMMGYAAGGPIPSEGGMGGNFTGGQGWYPPGQVGGAMVPPWTEPTPLPSPPTGGDWGQGSPTQYGGNYPSSMDVGQPSTFSGAYGGYVPAYGGVPAFGATQIGTNWVNYPGVGWVPMAVDPSSEGNTPMSGGGGGGYGGISGGGIGFGGLGSAFSPGGWASGAGAFGVGTAGGPSWQQVRSY